ncbi:MAG: ABC transporter permease/substrate-binding protein [Xanthobacteraceae bacterium]|nr:ABC transporter permease/substrate-binding protein [Xanthobacteraceae bacterium]
MIADSNIADALARLPEYLGGHVLVSMTALLLGLAVSFPLAIISLRRPTLRRILLAVASVAQTIPGLALLALFYPLLLALAALTERMFGIGFSALGFLPSVLALALYSMLPVLRNTITGLEGIDPAVTEAARGVGMTPRQSLTMVELPLALPVIMAGIRTAAVWVIGTATLSTPIGQTSLGNYIFTGLQTQNWVFVLFGCVTAAVLALVVDQLLALMETGVARRNRRRVAFGAVGLVCLLAASLLPSLGRQGVDYIVGSKPFSEQYVLAALMQQRLLERELSAGRRDGLGSGVIFDALTANEIDVYVEYTGTIWANQMQRSDVKSREEVMREVTAWLKERHGITVAGGLGFENAYALAMSASRAKALGVRSIADLASHAPTLTIAGDYEFFGRPEWAALRNAYGLKFRAERTMQPEFMYPAAEAGEVDVIAGYTSDGRMTRHKLALLDDPKQAIPPYDAIILVAPKRANDRALLDALKPLTGAIDVALMREANLRATAPDATPARVARWLWAEIDKHAGQKK